jgi:hypothetical protein
LRVKEVVQVGRLDRGHPGKCPLCSLDSALTFEVIYYRESKFHCCRVCATALHRHMAWLTEAHKRYLQNRTRMAENGR